MTRNCVTHHTCDCRAARAAEYEAWIQRAKALLFVLRFATDSRSLRAEALSLITAGGGYDERTETPTSPLRWSKEDTP